MALRVYLEKDKQKRAIGIAQLILGIVALIISIGLFAKAVTSAGTYALPLFAMIVSVYMILNARVNFLAD